MLQVWHWKQVCIRLAVLSLMIVTGSSFDIQVYIRDNDESRLCLIGQEDFFQPVLIIKEGSKKRRKTLHTVNSL